MEANPKTFESLKKDGGIMCEQLMRLMKPEFDAAVKVEVDKAVKAEVDKAVKANTQKNAVDMAMRMLVSARYTFEEIAEMAALPLEEVKKLAESI